MASVPDAPESRGERRRFPRVDVPAHAFHLTVVHDIEVVDISSTGVMFTSLGDLQVGQRARLLTVLGGRPFSAALELRRLERESPLSPDARRSRFGAIFLSMDETSQQALHRFLRIGTPEP